MPQAREEGAHGQWRDRTENCGRSIRHGRATDRPVEHQALSGRRTFMTLQNQEEIPQAELDRFGIQRIPADVFLWGGYRYSNARDALAAAKRNARS